MATKTKGKTGFRNEELFCFNCGRSYKIPYPQPITMATAMMTQFAKDHANCEPTWKEPINETPGQTEEFCANWWAENGEHGMSSKTMFNHLTQSLQVRRLKNDYPCTPSDIDDFKRCYKLLQAVPQWKARLNELKTLSPIWEKLVDNWDVLEKMFLSNDKNMYSKMKKLGC